MEIFVVLMAMFGSMAVFGIGYGLVFGLSSHFKRRSYKYVIEYVTTDRESHSIKVWAYSKRDAANRYRIIVEEYGMIKKIEKVVDNMLTS